MQTFGKCRCTVILCRPFFRTGNGSFNSAAYNDFLRSTLCSALLSRCQDSLVLSSAGNKAVVCAISASYISTFAGYPVRDVTIFTSKKEFNLRLCQLDSLKSRLQTTRTPITVPKLAALVYREEGIIGFYRGLWIPLMTISFVRTWPNSLSLMGFMLTWRSVQVLPASLSILVLKVRDPDL